VRLSAHRVRDAGSQYMPIVRVVSFARLEERVAGPRRSRQTSRASVLPVRAYAAQTTLPYVGFFGLLALVCAGVYYKSSIMPSVASSGAPWGSVNGTLRDQAPASP
jgi:hypothetical protein